MRIELRMAEGHDATLQQTDHLCTLLAFHFRQRHPHANVVATIRQVAVGLSFVVRFVLSKTVQEVSTLVRFVDE